MTFTVRSKSIFRAYTEPNRVDIDFALKAGNIPVPHEVFETGAEKLSYVLSPNVQYTFVVSYYYDFDLLAGCPVPPLNSP